MARTAGIELTEDRIRLAVVDHRGKQTRVVDYVAAGIPGDADKPWGERAAAALGELVRGKKIPADRCVASIDTGHAILGELHTPFKDEQQIARTVKFEMENLIPDHPIEDFIVDFHRSSSDEKGTFLLGAAMPKTVIRDHLTCMRSHHVEPSALDADICAVINAFIAAGIVDGEALTILIHGNTKFTKFALIENRRLRSLRTMRFSIAIEPKQPETTPAAAPAPEGETTPAEGEPIVVLPNDEAKSLNQIDFKTQQTLIKILARELARFTMSSTSAAAPAKVLLSGIFDDPATVDMLKHESDAPIEAAGFDARFPWASGIAPSRDAATVIGLALKAAGVDAIGMDFRREEFAYRKRFDRIKAGLLSTLLIVNILLGMVLMKFAGDADQFSGDYEQILRRQAEVFATVFPKEPIRERDRLFGQMDDLRRQEEARIGGGGYPVEVSSLVAWQKLFDVLALFNKENQNTKFLDEDLYVALERIEINQDRKEMILSGVAVNVNCAEALSTALSREPAFASVQLGAIQPTKENKVSFKVTAVLNLKGAAQ